MYVVFQSSEQILPLKRSSNMNECINNILRRMDGGLKRCVLLYFLSSFLLNAKKQNEKLQKTSIQQKQRTQYAACVNKVQANDGVYHKVHLAMTSMSCPNCYRTDMVSIPNTFLMLLSNLTTSIVWCCCSATSKSLSELIIRADAGNRLSSLEPVSN